MTALNFVIEEDRICFAMDTLSLGFDDHQPLAFLTKYVILPHLQTIVTGTGHGMVVSDWMAMARSNIVARDIDHVNQYTPSALLRIGERYPELVDTTATVYHFGYSECRKRFLCYAYRSTTNWKPEEILDGIGMKPRIEFSVEDSMELPSLFVELMERQREQDMLLPPAGRVGIGGHIHFIVMSKHGVHVSTCHRFSSYEDDYRSICTRLTQT